MIPDEAVEAAARSIHAKVCGGMGDGFFCSWECKGLESYLPLARAALEAAAPHIAAQAWDAGASIGFDEGQGHIVIRTPNPYRKDTQ